MPPHGGTPHVAAAAVSQGPGLLFTLGGGPLPQTAQVLFMTSLFAAALAFHNAVWRYIFALGRESVLPSALGRTGANNIPKAASLTQSVTGLVTILLYAVTGLDPMSRFFFWLGTAGGFGILLLLTITAASVIVFFARGPGHCGETAWRRLTAPALAAVLLAGIVVLAVQHYHTLLGVAPGDPAAWVLPATYGVAALTGFGWGLTLKLWRPGTYAAISHFHDPGPLSPAIEAALDLILAMRKSVGWLPQVVCPGGGWGVAYHESELPHPPVDTAQPLQRGDARRHHRNRWNQPEPGHKRSRTKMR